MNEEQWRQLLEAIVTRRASLEGVTDEAALDRMWEEAHGELLDILDTAGEEGIRREYDAWVGQLPQLAGLRARQTGGDSTAVLRQMFGADPAVADSIANEAMVDDHFDRMPESRRRNIEMSPTMQVMRAVPNISRDAAMAMPRSRQDAIVRSDAANTTLRGDGSLRDLGRAFGDEMGRRGRMGADMDEMGVGRLNRAGAAGVYGLPMAAHRLVKGALGAARFAPGAMGAGSGAAYDSYSRLTKPFEESYDAVTPALGKSGLAGEVVGALPVDIPLYMSGTKAIEALPLLQRMMAGGRMAGMAARVGSNAAVDATQGALMEAGEQVPTKRGFGLNVGLNVGLGAPLNVGMEGLGAMFGRARNAGAFDINTARAEADVAPTVAEGARPNSIVDSERAAERLANDVFKRRGGPAFDLLDESKLPPRINPIEPRRPGNPFELLDMSTVGNVRPANAALKELLKERRARPRSHGFMVPEY